MNFKTPEELEKLKEQIALRAEREMDELYVVEVKKVLEWFRDKFPKRHLRWMDGMGCHFWVLDDEILDCDIHVPDHESTGQFSKHMVMKRVPLTRIQRVLKPLVDFQESIETQTHTFECGVQIGGWEIDRVSKEIVQCFQ